MKSYLLTYLRKEPLTALNFQQAGGLGGGGARERAVGLFFCVGGTGPRGPIVGEVVVGLSVESSWKELQ